jgi:hypothetical protein
MQPFVEYAGGNPITGNKTVAEMLNAEAMKLPSVQSVFR